jgi:hypothetical protein
MPDSQAFRNLTFSALGWRRHGVPPDRLRSALFRYVGDEGLPL